MVCTRSGTAALVSEAFLGVATELSPLATLVGAYSVGLYATRARARWGLFVVVVGVVGYFVGTPGLGKVDYEKLRIDGLAQAWGWTPIRPARGPGIGRHGGARTRTGLGGPWSGR